MVRAGLDRQVVIGEALAVVDELGTDGLTFAALASRLGVKAPSLYKHVEGLVAVKQAVTVQSKIDLSRELERAIAGRSGSAAIRALASEYRRWALDYPRRYRMTITAPDAAHSADVDASQTLYDMAKAAVRELALTGQVEVDVIRHLRSALHGFVDLETSGGFGLPVDVDRSFDGMIDALVLSFGERSPLSA